MNAFFNNNKKNSGIVIARYLEYVRRVRRKFVTHLRLLPSFKDINDSKKLINVDVDKRFVIIHLGHFEPSGDSVTVPLSYTINK